MGDLGWRVFGEDFVEIEGPYGHSLGLRPDGSIVAWGNNDGGQCEVPGQNTRFARIAAGGAHSLGLKSDGSIVAWGNNRYGQCDVPDRSVGPFVDIGASDKNSYAYDPDGGLFAWGRGFKGPTPVELPLGSFKSIPISELLKSGRERKAES